MMQWIIGAAGVALCGLVGTQYADLSTFEIAEIVVLSNLVAMATLHLVLRLEAVKSIDRTLLNSSLKTWALFWVVYLGGHVALMPPLRDPRRFALLFFPLLMTDHLMFAPFGWIQDRIVRRAQRKLLR